MAFFTTNEDVFMFSGQLIGCSSNLRLAEHRTADDCPVRLDIELVSATGNRGAVDITWRKVSKTRRERGDVVDFTIEFQRDNKPQPGDFLMLRFPFNPEVLSDPDFAVTGAASFHAPIGGALLGADLGFGAEQGLEFALPFPDLTSGHLATG